jgi:GST-like protein
MVSDPSSLAPIDFYAWPTPNGTKVAIFFEEVGLPYTIHAVNLNKGEQYTPDFLKISPNGKIPAISDPDGPEGKPLSLFESGAILMYLARKVGRFYGKTPHESAVIDQWVFWQTSGIGPIFGQLTHFRLYALETIPYAIERFTQEAERLLDVMNHWLSRHEFMGTDYSIADMACISHVNKTNDLGLSLENRPHVKRWLDAMLSRPGVQKGLALKDKLPL